MVLLVACAIGLLTGGGVVLFNIVIHSIRHLAWQGTSLEDAKWAYAGLKSRALALHTPWYLLVGPPIMGGLVVGAMRSLSGGLHETPSLDPLMMRARSQRQSLWPGISFTMGIPRQPGPKAKSDSIQPAKADQAPSEATARGQQDGMLNMPASTSSARNTAAEEDLQAMLEQPRQSGQHDAGAASTSTPAESPFAPVLRALAAAVTLGTGNSLGPEGPRYSFHELRHSQEKQHHGCLAILVSGLQ